MSDFKLKPIMQTFNLDTSRIGTGRLFPDEIENRDWIGYHCTSSYYAQEIEHDGFSQKKPIDDSDVDLVISVAKEIGVDAGGVEGFKALASISFSPISEICLSYVQPQSLGGQGVGFVFTAVKEILETGNGLISTETSERLISLCDRIEQIRRAVPIIYAVNLEGLNPAVYQNATKAVHVYTRISPGRIIAKLIIDHHIDVEAIDVASLKSQLNYIYHSGEPHFINRIES